MNPADEVTRLVDDLAARWTDPVLEFVKAAGAGPITVETELSVWQALRTSLEAVFRPQRSPRATVALSWKEVIERVLLRATLSVVRQSRSTALPSGLEARLRRLAGERDSTRNHRRPPGPRAKFATPGAAPSPLGVDRTTRAGGPLALLQ